MNLRALCPEAPGGGEGRTALRPKPPLGRAVAASTPPERLRVYPTAPGWYRGALARLTNHRLAATFCAGRGRLRGFLSVGEQGRNFRASSFGSGPAAFLHRMTEIPTERKFMREEGTRRFIGTVEVSPLGVAQPVLRISSPGTLCEDKPFGFIEFGRYIALLSFLLGIYAVIKSSKEMKSTESACVRDARGRE